MASSIHPRLFAICAFAAAFMGCDQSDPADDWQSGGGAAGNTGLGGGAAGNSPTGAGPDGEAPSPSGDPATDVAAQLYPYIAGARWTYTHTDPQNPAWDEEVALDAAQYQGRDVLLLTDTPGPSGTQTRSFLERDGTEVRRIHKEVLLNGASDSVVDYDAGFTRFDEAWPLAPLGTVETRGYTRTETAPDGTQLVEMRMQQYTVESAGVEITVPAGTFGQCLVIYRERRAPDGGPVAAGSERQKRFWFCPGVGKVREENLTDGGVEVLTQCSVPGGNC